jgi:phosphoribosylformylglycinamidine cyclo-ligase
MDNELELAGSAWGIIKDKRRLIQGSNLQPDDAVILLESNGVHANGISLIRRIAAELPAGYATPLSDGTSLGETVLQPTHLYARTVAALLDAEIDVHYLSNITGHGWRKLMRAEPNLTYRMHMMPRVDPVFDFIAERSHNDPHDMYGTFNMGAGYAVYLPQAQATTVCEIAADHGLEAWHAGTVEVGPKQVIIEPLDLVFNAASLAVRK